jgi:Flp pilus assembly protein TadB
MGKIGIGVGEDFPVDEAAEPRTCEDRDKEYEAQRRAREAWHAEWHERAHRFKDDVRRSYHEHFGDRGYLAHNYFVLRVLGVVAIVALVLALMPHVLMFALMAVALGAVLFAALRHGIHHHAMPPHGGDRI